MSFIVKFNLKLTEDARKILYMHVAGNWNTEVANSIGGNVAKCMVQETEMKQEKDLPVSVNSIFTFFNQLK